MQGPSKQFDGNELLRNCNEAVRLADGEKLDLAAMGSAMFCQTYVAAWIDGYVAAKTISEQNWRFPYCPPSSGWDNTQSVRIVTKWLKDNPEQLHNRATLSVMVALSKAFPCRQN
jgi:hypothetical protein